MEIQPVILSGGAGTRLWPLSRELYPKQLLPLVGKASLFQQTLSRVTPNSLGSSVLAPIVIANENHRFLIAEQTRALNISCSIVLEPVGRNTAPAAAVAALMVEPPEDALLLILPADHVIGDQDAFVRAIELAKPLAEKGDFVLFGIVPTSPHTGYGYIKAEESAKAASLVHSFVEKPSLEKAQDYLAKGGYYWNSGMFLVRADVWNKALNELNPSMFSACAKALSQAKRDLDFIRLDAAAFAASPSDSIDYAVAEKLAQLSWLKAHVVPMDAKWSDLGAWPSVAEQLPSDAKGNTHRGDVLFENANDCFAWSESRLVALAGVKDLIVVETPDAVLVTHKEQAQSVKGIVEKLRKLKRSESELHQKVYRPWGSYEGVDAGERFQVKRICVNPGASLSLQKHFHRAEHWVVVTGTAEVTRGEDVFLVSENESTFIPLGTVHRLRNPGKLMLEMIEVQSGSYLGEDDIVRLEDVYGRGGQSKL